MKRLTACVVILSIALCATADETVRVRVIKDNSIVLYRTETHLNAGTQRRIRIKGNQHFVTLGFDTAPLKGKLVKSAVLVCRRAARSIDGVTLSTIQADWNEYKSNALTSARQRYRGWAWPKAVAISRKSVK